MEVEAQRARDSNDSSASENDSSDWEEEMTAEQDSALDNLTNPDSESSTTAAEQNFAWDNSSNSDRGSTPATEQDFDISTDADDAGWDSHAAKGSEDWRDSGYISDASPSPEDPPVPLSAEAIKYSQLPFVTKHHFLTHIQRILEATCLDYARTKLSGYLGDLEWKKKKLMFPSGEYEPDKYVYRDWLAEDGIELKYWLKMFHQCFRAGLKKPYGEIFNAAVFLRNAAAHRNDLGDFGFEELSLAMQLPEILGDVRREVEIDDAFRYIMEDPTLDDDDKESVKTAMFSPPPCTSHYRLLGRIQTMLEETCFNYAFSKIPEVLQKNGWEIPQQIELQQWYDVFFNYYVRHDDEAHKLFPYLDNRSLLDALSGARNKIRNVVAHRELLTDEEAVQQVHAAIMICILMGAWQQAVEVEVLAEGYFTRRSRKQVMWRLKVDFWRGEMDCLYERERRVAIAKLLRREDKWEVAVEEGEELVVADCEGVCNVRAPVEKVYCTDSPSMHECLKRVVVW